MIKHSKIPWKAYGCNVFNDDPEPIAICRKEGDAAFIAIAGNYFEAVVDILGAANAVLINIGFEDKRAIRRAIKQEINNGTKQDK